jgi:release factor glutamine methyltransferase
MTLDQTIRKTSLLLKQHDIEDSYFEARILLGHVLELSPEEILTQPEYSLNTQQIETLNAVIQRRINREPSAYITGHKEFYGIDFMVDRRVLIPRPETELLVEEALKFLEERCDSSVISNKHITVADIGTGCGAISISLALHTSDVEIYATDISQEALEVARQNAHNHNVQDRISFLHGNLLEPIPKPVDLIVANLPYIEHTELDDLSAEINRFEPHIALNGGNTGLLYIEQLIGHSKGKLRERGCILLEIGYNQSQYVTEFVHRSFNEVHCEFVPDPNDIKRVVKIFPRSLSYI